MASFVSQAQAAAATLTYPSGIQAGDVILYFGYRNTTTAPTLPTGFTNITNGSGNANSYRLCWKTAVGTESGTASPTFTNASGVEVVVYRGIHDIGAVNDAPHAASTTMTFLALTMERSNSTSWVACFGGSKQSTSTSTPSGLTLRGTVQNVTSGSMAAFDTNGPVSSFAAANSTLGASATYAVVSVELRVNLKTEALFDTFNDNSLDATKWSSFTDTGITVAETNQELEITNTGANATYGGIIAGGVYDLLDLTGSYLYARFKDVGAQTWASKEIEMHLIKDAASANSLFFLIGDGSGSADTLYAYRRVASANTAVASVAYNATNHQWLCISEGNGRPGASGRTAGTIYWDAAPDDGTGNPGTWSNIGSWAATFQFYNMQPQIDFGHWQAEGTPASIIVKVDNLNTGTSAVPTNLFFF